VLGFDHRVIDRPRRLVAGVQVRKERRAYELLGACGTVAVPADRRGQRKVVPWFDGASPIRSWANAVPPINLR
jgi:hypothetical protein